MLDRLEPRLQPLDYRGKGGVVEEHSIFGVIGDVDELIVEQAGIDGMDDPAHADRAIPADEMAAVVHRQRCDAVPLPDPEPLQRARKLARIAGDTRPVRPRFVAGRPARDDLALAMLALRMIQKPHYAKWPILHSADHQRLPIHGRQSKGR